MDEAKRSLAQKVHLLYNESLLQKTLKEYYAQKSMVSSALRFGEGNQEHQVKFDDITSGEKTFVLSDNISVIKMKTQQLKGLLHNINSRDRRPLTNEELVTVFHSLKFRKFNDQPQADKLLEKGNAAVKKNDILTLSSVLNDLFMIGMRKDDDENTFRKQGTGLK